MKTVVESLTLAEVNALLISAKAKEVSGILKIASEHMLESGLVYKPMTSESRSLLVAKLGMPFSMEDDYYSFEYVSEDGCVLDGLESFEIGEQSCEFIINLVEHINMFGFASIKSLTN